MLDVTVDADSVQLRLEGSSARVHSELVKEATSLSLMLRNYVITAKLSGQVLNHRTGKLWQSIYALATQDNGNAVIGGVEQSNSVAPYGAILERGGQTAPHDIFPKNASALHFFMGGREVFAKVVHHPGSHFEPRWYMRSSLGDKASEIVNGLKAAVVRGMQ